MAQEAIIDGNLITDDRPLAVEVQNDVLAVDGPLTDAELRATPPAVEIQGSINGTLATLQMDAATAALTNIPYEHHEIHEGDMFDLFVYDTDLDDTDELIVAFTTAAAAEWVHLTVRAACSGASLFEILRAPTITADTGTDLTPINRNGNSANTSGVLSIKAVPVVNQATRNPTITNDGTQIWAETLGGNKNQSVGMTGGSRDERVLDQAVTHAIRITAEADNLIASLSCTYYEHTSVA